MCSSRPGCWGRSWPPTSSSSTSSGADAAADVFHHRRLGASDASMRRSSSCSSPWRDRCSCSSASSTSPTPPCQFGRWSFAYDDMQRLAIPMGSGFWHSPQLLLFAAFGLAFAIKVPVWPLHTWLPDAHVEAPTGLDHPRRRAAQLGAFGFLRFNRALLPEAWRAATRSSSPGVIAIIYGAWCRGRRRTSRSSSPTRRVAHGLHHARDVAGTVTSTQGRSFRWSITASRPERCSCSSA